MLLQHPFGVITPTVDGDVLAVLAGAEAAFTTGDVARLVPDRSIEGIRRALTRLVGHGVVDAEQVGRTVRYRLNREHLAADAVVAVARQRSTLLTRVRERLAAWRPRPVHAALFGSAARGDMHLGSDVDLFLVRPDDAPADRWEDQVDALSRDVTRWTGNDTRVLAMTESEVRAGAASGDPVLASVRDDGLPLIGPEGWLRRALREGAAS
ncbi:nucleotidyltransferase domain-containing protein [Cellulomonas sp.]|uniref:nucleotidyltransferase domain-containing protein n=1 Tax=Cellulomonas sp. TaxID=40001 RepID=UPI002D4F903A|nr:nucleotidyltransferase domain-containing protein [Cellulomonas sp.]HYQ74974.1 nucleotidyltransferase domain-containing protein [Cellulomonas sp.]